MSTITYELIALKYTQQAYRMNHADCGQSCFALWPKERVHKSPDPEDTCVVADFPDLLSISQDIPNKQ